MEKGEGLCLLPELFIHWIESKFIERTDFDHVRKDSHFENPYYILSMYIIYRFHIYYFKFNLISQKTYNLPKGKALNFTLIEIPTYGLYYNVSTLFFRR